MSADLITITSKKIDSASSHVFVEIIRGQDTAILIVNEDFLVLYKQLALGHDAAVLIVNVAT